jgi:zinc transporter ZupT
MFVHKSVVLLLAIVGRLSARRHGAFAFGPRSVGSTLTGTLRTSPPDKKQLVLRPTGWTEWPSPVDKATGSMAVRAMAAETAVAAAEAASSVGRSIDWAPLVLSLMAGLSTCIGASVVFLAQWRRRRGVATVTAATAATDGSATTTTSLKGKDLAAPIISHAHLCFSIAFAGSVMVTVSLFSLLPESFSSDESSAASTSSFLLSPSTRDFWYRVASFLAGGGLCLLLSKAAFPEPEDVLDDLYNPENADVEEEIVPLIQERKIPAGQPSRQLSIVKRQASTLVGADKAHRPPPTTLLVATRTANSTTADVESNPIDAVGAASSAARSGPERPRGATSSSGSGGGGWWWSRFASGSDLTTTEAKRSWRVALLLFASLLAHNFPEGFAVAASSMHSPKLGVTTAVAIAFHNIVRLHHRLRARTHFATQSFPYPFFLREIHSLKGSPLPFRASPHGPIRRGSPLDWPVCRALPSLWGPLSPSWCCTGSTCTTTETRTARHRFPWTLILSCPSWRASWSRWRATSCSRRPGDTPKTAPDPFGWESWRVP